MDLFATLFDFASLINILLLLAAIVSAVLFFRTLYIILFTPTLQPSKNLNSITPKISILLPVRNEASRMLKENVKSLISQNYPRLEIIAVDDRSTDKSLNVLQEFASVENSKIKLVNGLEPPKDWIGKTYALHQAKRTSSGEWLVAVDADVSFSDNIILTPFDFACKHNLDALSLLPRVIMVTFWEAVVLPVISWLSLMRVSTTQANRKSSKACFGYGNFILFRRTAHDFIGGFEAYRSDILDDCAIMDRLKACGFNVMIAYGGKLMSSRMYTSLKEIFLGFGKNSFAALRYSVPRSIGVILSELLFLFFPHIFILYKLLRIDIELSTSILFAIAAVLCFFLTMFSFGLRMKADIRFYIFYILGHAISIFIIAYSMISYVLGKGVLWKDRIIVKN